MAESVGSRLNFWKTKPMRCLRSRVRSASLERGKVNAVNHHAALGGARQPAQQVEQRGLARARRPHDGHKLPALNGERNPAHRGDLELASRVNLGQVFGNDNRRRVLGLHISHCKRGVCRAVHLEWEWNRLTKSGFPSNDRRTEIYACHLH